MSVVGNFGFLRLLVISIALSTSSPLLAQQASPASLSLGDVVALTIATNPAALAAKESVTQAQAALKSAESQTHFQLTFNSVAGVSNASVLQPPPSQETFGGVQNSLTVPIPVGPKTNLLVLEADRQLSSATSAYQSYQMTLASRTASAYFDLLRARALVAAAQLDLDTSKRQLSDAQSRNAAGDIPELDVMQAQVPVAADQAELISADSSQLISLEALNDLLGRPLDQELVIDDVTSVQTAPEYTIDDARVMALKASPDIAASNAAVAADESAEAASKRYNDPTLSLSAIDQRSGDVTSFSRDDTLQASISIPIDDGGLGRSLVQSAASSLVQAKLLAASAVKSALTSVSASYLEVQSSVAEVSAAKTALDIAQTAYEKTMLGYSNGLYPLVDALSSQKAEADARTAYIQSLYDAANARFTLDTEVNGLPGDNAAK